MKFRYSSSKMAQALSIVAEEGIHGKEHDGLMERWLDRERQHQSKRARVSLRSAHRFSGSEFENYMILAWRFGFIERSKFKEVEMKSGLDKSAYELGTETIRLTREGWEFVERYDRTLLERWFYTLAERVPFVLLSIVAAALTTWAISFWGAPTTGSESPVHSEKGE